MAENGTNETGRQNGGGGSLLDSLKKENVLVPGAAALATAVAAGWLANKAPKALGSAEDKLEDEAEDLGRSTAAGAKHGLTGGSSGMLGKVAGAASKVAGGGGGGSAKKTRRLTIQRWTDVAVPVNVAYEQWLRFEDYPKFMHRVLNVKRRDDDRVSWDEKIWFSKRHWEAEITERRKNDRIAWKATEGMNHFGVVSFHRLDDHLTRVMVTMEFVPQGVVEKMASGLRFVKRAVQADLARFKSFVEMKDAKGLEYGNATRNGESSGKQSNRQRSETSSRSERQAHREERRQAASTS